MPKDIAIQILQDQINEILPQTQCTRCGFVDCKAYAHAIANSSAAINQCPPGGEAGIAKIAFLTRQKHIPLNTTHGTEEPVRVARVIEEDCIGCTKCIQACPVDAIVGTSKMMHYILEDICTGCELCIPPCPTDCIELTFAQEAVWTVDRQTQSRHRYEFRTLRLIKEQQEFSAFQETQLVKKLGQLQNQESPPTSADELSETKRKQMIVEAALAKARLRRQDKT